MIDIYLNSTKPLEFRRVLEDSCYLNKQVDFSFCMYWSRDQRKNTLQRLGIWFQGELGGGFKTFLFSSLLGEMIQFDYFSDGVENHQLGKMFPHIFFSCLPKMTSKLACSCCRTNTIMNRSLRGCKVPEIQMRLSQPYFCTATQNMTYVAIRIENL